jgi:hypothetical protein
VGGADAADTDRLVEIEFAIGQLAGPGQALAEGVEAVGLGLQLAQARGQRIDFALGLGAGGIELRLLGRRLVAQVRHLGEAGRGTDAGAEDDAGRQHDRSGESRTLHGTIGALAPETGEAPARIVDEVVHAFMQGHAMSGSRSSNAPPGPRPKAPTGPRVALEALFTGSAADPIRRALWLDALDQRLRPHLPPSLAAHARLANVNGVQLVFLVDSPVWSARLRLATPELLDAARSVGLEVTQVVVRTATRSPDRGTASPRPALPMSAAAREALEDALSSLREPDPTGAEGDAS